MSDTRAANYEELRALEVIKSLVEQSKAFNLANEPVEILGFEAETNLQEVA